VGVLRERNRVGVPRNNDWEGKGQHGRMRVCGGSYGALFPVRSSADMMDALIGYTV